jgi:RNA-directed DNA polymerase
MSFRKYKPRKIKRVWIPKPNTSDLKPLRITTIKDRALQALVLLSLDPIIEELSNQYSYGARKFRSPHDSILRLHSLLNKPNSPKWIYDLDISKCFDNISHKFIEKEIDPLLCKPGKVLIQKWIKAGIVEKGITTWPSKGVPQGGVIPPSLCNLTLNGI